MKRILFIGMTPNKAGVETYIMNIFTKLKHKDYKFEFLNLYDKPLAYSSYIKKNGGIIKKININRNPLFYFSRFKSAKDFFKKNNNYDVVYLNTSTINMIYWLKAANIYGIKQLIIHSHDNNSKHNSFIINYVANLVGYYNRFFLKNKRIIELAVSNDSGYWMFRNNSFKVIPNGINPKSYVYNKDKKNNLKNNMGFNYNSKILMTIARLEPQKNCFRIIKIFNAIHKISSDVYLVIIGDGSQKEELKKLVNKLGLNNEVIFVGEIENVNDMLNIADLIIMPSIHEGFPFSLIESQAAGVSGLVSYEAVPQESNVTGQLKYLSLKEDDYKWAITAIKMIKKKNDKIYMNKLISSSPYTINNLSKQIEHILR